MVVVSQAALDHFALIKMCKPSSPTFNEVPVIDLAGPDADSLVVKACEEFGFFKVVNHGVPAEVMNRLESEAVDFFSLPQSEKDKAGPPHPFGYGSKRIGPNGDVGWIEYLLLDTNYDVDAFSRNHSLSFFQESDGSFRKAVDDYMRAVKEVGYGVLELIGDGLKILEGRGVLSGMVRDVKSDSCLRLNHYPPCPELSLSGRNLIGFGEHTDPHIISVLRSNNTSGLQICLRDGTWVSVPPDHSSFFINVGDSLQVLTNGRFKSVKHRVLADHAKSRVSMIYFGGPSLSEKIAPLPSLLAAGERSLYREFTWSEYKQSAYKSRLADYRLGAFEKSPDQDDDDA